MEKGNEVISISNNSFVNKLAQSLAEVIKSTCLDNTTFIMKSIDLMEYRNKNIVNYELCSLCNKNTTICKENDTVCIAVEMLRQLSEERSIMTKLEMLDNVREYFE